MYQVEKLARESFFFLKASVRFDESSFGVLSDEASTKKSMLVSAPISYVFHLHPPPEFLHGDDPALTQQHLNPSYLFV